VEDHLRRVAEGVEGCFHGAAVFASAFQAGDWGRVAGLWHDLGKFSDSFQEYLCEAGGGDAHVEEADAGAGPRATRRVDHSTFGARHAIEKGWRGWPLGYVIAGHHAGLPDWTEIQGRCQKPGIEAPHAPEELMRLALPDLPPLCLTGELPSETAFRLAFFTRMVFSCLVDADFLATEWFMSKERHAARTATSHPSLPELRHAVDAHLTRLAAHGPATTVNVQRAAVLEACRARATEEPGFFSLTVPTGGGKTLSSLAFALNHAIAHGLGRVIYAIPFTTIIEQNAEVFREALGALGASAMIEHHVNFEPAREDRWSRLAAENWDAPVILTTNVQIFESLFSNKPSRCRKLHRVARSVIILDEAQTIPVTLLKPTLAALNELVRNYRCSVVLCTATQPALAKRSDFAIGIDQTREIVPDVPTLYAAMQRVVVEPIRTLDDESLASELSELRRVLCIVNTKRQAAEVWRAVSNRTGDGSCIHLSTSMCPEHRSQALRQIHSRLDAGRPCRVVSTSLIEAGVDVDFPVVYRAFAGFDAIAQAAGRCNRHGALPAPGRVVVFHTQDKPPTYQREAIQSATTVARHFPDPIAPPAIAAYFMEHYWRHSDRWDAHKVLDCFKTDHRPDSPFIFDFRTASERYRLIEDDQRPVIVPWASDGRGGALQRRTDPAEMTGPELVELLSGLTRPATPDLRRSAQRYVVGVFDQDFARLYEKGLIATTPLAPGMVWLEDINAYHPQLGLQSDGVPDPGRLMA
jgi:CRISPR-associated endonuclease/helicase Cas3